MCSRQQPCHLACSEWGGGQVSQLLPACMDGFMPSNTFPPLLSECCFCGAMSVCSTVCAFLLRTGRRLGGTGVRPGQQPPARPKPCDLIRAMRVRCWQLVSGHSLTRQWFHYSWSFLPNLGPHSPPSYPHHFLLPFLPLSLLLCPHSPPRLPPPAPAASSACLSCSHGTPCGCGCGRHTPSLPARSSACGSTRTSR